MGCLAVLLLIALLGLAACGSDDESATTDPDIPKPTATIPTDDPPAPTGPPSPDDIQSPPRPKEPKPGAAKFTGVHRETYKTARFVCGASPARKVARDVGMDSTNPLYIATGYAEDYRPGFRQAAFEGCLAGLR